jgi:hypothetical protein
MQHEGENERVGTETRALAAVLFCADSVKERCSIELFENQILSMNQTVRTARQEELRAELATQATALCDSFASLQDQ